MYRTTKHIKTLHDIVTVLGQKNFHYENENNIMS
jgi:hypothetical protein